MTQPPDSPADESAGTASQSVLQAIDFENDRRFRDIVFSRGVEIPKWALLQIIAALPSDARLFHADFDFTRNQYGLAVWSSEFEHVPLGYQAPLMTAWMDTEKRLAGLNSEPF
jgi:hypothetical protein